MDEFKGLYNVRDMLPEDRNFILSTFLKGLYYGDSWFSLMPKNVFMDNYKNIAEALIASPKHIVKVACLPDEPSVILGYSIISYDYQGIDWVFVKSAWRNKGIGRSLVPQAPVYITHLTRVGLSLMSKFENVIFNPFNI